MTLNRNIAPEIQEIEKVNFLKPTRHELSNGIEVYILNSGIQELTRVEIIFEAGKWQSNKVMLSSLTSSMLLEGTKSKSSYDIAEIIDSKGAYLEISSDNDYSIASLFCLNKFLPTMLPIFAEVLTQAIFPAKEFEILINKRKQNFLVNSQKVGFVAKNQFASLIFGEKHPYGRYTKMEDFEHIDRNELIHFFTENYSFSSCKIIVSGKIESSFIEILDKEFGVLQTNSAIKKFQSYDITPSIVKEKSISMENAVQNAIRIGCQTIDRTNTDFQSLSIVNTILGGYFGSRLMTNIREDKGYTYGIGSGITSFKNASIFFISSEVKSENSNDVVFEIKNEIDKLQNHLIETEELELVKNYIQGSFQRGFDGVFSQADRFRDLLLWNLEYDYYDKFIENVKKIDKNEIRRIASKYLNQECFRSLIVGKIN